MDMEPGQTGQHTGLLVAVAAHERRDDLAFVLGHHGGQRRLRTDLCPHPHTQLTGHLHRISEPHRPPSMLHPIRRTPEVRTSQLTRHRRHHGNLRRSEGQLPYHRGEIIQHTGRTVPSTQANTHGHRIGVWELTAKGRRIAAQRAARAQQGRAA